jgi:hypothetical protein
MLQLYKPHHNVSSSAGYCGIHLPGSGYAASHPINEILSVYGKRGFAGIHGRERLGQPAAGALPRQRSRSCLLGDHLFCSDALLSAQRILISNTFSNQQSHDHFLGGNIHSSQKKVLAK